METGFKPVPGWSAVRANAAMSVVLSLLWAGLQGVSAGGSPCSGRKGSSPSAALLRRASSLSRGNSAMPMCLICLENLTPDDFEVGHCGLCFKLMGGVYIVANTKSCGGWANPSAMHNALLHCDCLDRPKAQIRFHSYIRKALPSSHIIGTHVP